MTELDQYKSLPEPGGFAATAEVFDPDDYRHVAFISDMPDHVQELSCCGRVWGWTGGPDRSAAGWASKPLCPECRAAYERLGIVYEPEGGQG